MSSPNETLCPLDSLHCTLVFATNDWSADRRGAWLYGIVVGWGKEGLAEFEEKGFWNEEASKRLAKLHSNYKKLLKETGGRFA